MSLTAFPKGPVSPAEKPTGWVQIVLASLNDKGRATVVLDTGAASRGSGNANSNKEKEVRKWFVEHDLIEGVIYCRKTFSTTPPLPESSSSSTEPNQETEGISFFCSTPAASSSKAIRKTTFKRKPF